MLYLTNTTDAQVLFIPRNGESPGGTLTLVAESTIDNETYLETEVLDLGTSELYYRVSIELPEGLPSGEYDYSLVDDGEIVSTGILVIEGGAVEVSEYNTDITYEQYES